MFVPPRLTTWFALLLAAVLVTTQTLGLVHGIHHGAAGSLLHAHDHENENEYQHNHRHAHTEPADQYSGHFLEAFFSSHQEASDCRLYDHASHDAPLLAVAPLLLPVSPPASGVAIFAGEALARWAALFDARGPPLTV